MVRQDMARRRRQGASWAIAVAAIAGALAVLAGSCGAGDDDDANLGATTAALSPAQACADLDSLVNTHGLATIECSDALSEQHRTLLSQCWGLDPNGYKLEVDQQLGAAPALATSLSPAQVAAWKALHEESRGRAVVSWQQAKAAPSFVEVGLQLWGADRWPRGPICRAGSEATSRRSSA